jgi:hypothetical protein
MDDLTDIKKIWLNAGMQNLPAAGKLVAESRSIYTQRVLKNISLILLAIALTAGTVYVVLFYDSQMLSTRVGEGCFLLALLIVFATNLVDARRMSEFKNSSNNDFIQFLKAEVFRTTKRYRRTQSIGFVISSIGLLLYLYEIVHDEGELLYLAYLVTILFMLIGWFWIKPRALKRRIFQLQLTIQKLELIETQFHEK